MVWARFHKGQEVPASLAFQAQCYSDIFIVTDNSIDYPIETSFCYVGLNAFSGDVGEAIRLSLLKHGPKCSAPF